MLFSSIKNTFIYSPENLNVGKVKDAIVNYNTGKIDGLAIGSVFGFKSKMAKAENIKIIENKIIADPKNFFKISSEDKENQGSIIGFKVYTESDKYLGKVKDFDINTYLWRLSQIFASSRINSKNQLIISDSQIISISDEKIIVKDLAIEEAIPNLA